MTEYTGSKAFAGLHDHALFGRGTKTFIDGVALGEVKNIAIHYSHNRIHFLSNAVLDDPGQLSVMEFMEMGTLCGIEINLSDEAKTKLSFTGYIENVRLVIPVDVVDFMFDLRIVDVRVEDGPEVSIIKSHETGFIRAVMKAIADDSRAGMLKQLADSLYTVDLPASKFVYQDDGSKPWIPKRQRPAGGGFVEVTEGVIPNSW